MRLIDVEHAARMAVRGIDHDEVDPGVDQELGAGIAEVADRGRRGDAQTALLVLAGIGICDRLLDVLDGDQADAAVLLVDHQELLDPMLVQQTLGFRLAHALAHGHEPVLGHQLGHLLARVGGKAHVAIGQDADQLAGRRGPSALHYRHAGDAVLLHQVERLRERSLGMDGERIHHHAGFEFLYLPHLRRLFVRLEIAVDDADAAGLRHGDRHVHFRDGVHRRGDDRDVDGDLAGNPGAHVDLRRHHVRKPRFQQHVVEGQRFAGCAVRICGHSPTPLKSRGPPWPVRGR